MEIFGEEHTFLTKLKTPKYIYKYKWVVQNFNVNTVISGKFLQSPTFESLYNEGYLKFFSSGCSGVQRGYAAIAFHTMFNKDPTANVRIDFGIMNDKSEIAYRKTGGRQLNFPDSDIGCIDFIKRDDLYDPSKKLVVDNQITIVCTITELPTVDEDRHIYGQMNFEKDDNEVTLPTDLKVALNNKFLTDITLVVDGQEIYAHKLILATRSPVFATILESDMKEKQNSKIEIEDATADVLKKMLEFIYTDDVKIGNDAQDLMYLANKYDIKGLKRLCERDVIISLKYGYDYIEALKLAETYDCDVLKKEVLKYIIEHARGIIKTPEYQLWKKDLPPMVVDIIEAHV